MCGIAAIYAYHPGAPPVERTELERMGEAMRARGPDGSGLWLDPGARVGLAHRRLAIIDPSEAGTQPMAADRVPGRAAGQGGRRDAGQEGFPLVPRIVFNGEIYNYKDLRARLEAQGHVFVSETDTEVLLRLYQQHGPDMVEHLRGMFAFVIHDPVRQGLLLVRDHFGIKPLYLHDNGTCLRCASQVKALLAGRGVSPGPDAAGHAGFFVWGSVPEPHTLYAGLRALPAGHSLWVDRHGPRQPRCFFDPADELRRLAASRPRDLPPRPQLMAQALRDTVAHHLVADVPVGLFLSAGLDSSALAALAAAAGQHPRAVTLGFAEYQGRPEDEVPLARLVARRHGCAHGVEHVSRQDFDAALPAILEAMDQPSMDGVNTFFVARAAAASGLKVALSGLGGDELLGGYPGFRQIPRLLALARPLAAIPGLGRTLRRAAAPLCARLASPKHASLLEYGSSHARAYLLRRALFMPWELPRLMDPDMARQGWEELDLPARLEETARGLPTAHARTAALELCWYMRHTLLRDADWAGMAHSLEIRTPLVDIALFRALAPYMLCPGDLPDKSVLARAVEPPLPPEITSRAKTGFTVPITRWLGSQGKDRHGLDRGLRAWARKVHAHFTP